MPFEIQLDHFPAGLTLNAAREGESVEVLCREFTSTEDGQTFIHRLERIVDNILSQIGPGHNIRPSEIDHLLAVIHKDRKTAIYVNELNQILSIRVKRSMEKGDPVSKDDIADVDRFHLENISVPDDAGLVFLFSLGWRKGLFFDFGPLGPDKSPRVFNLEKAFGQFYSYLMFQERFNLSEDDWQLLFEAKWFPFVALKNSTIETVLNHLRSGWNDTEVQQIVIDEVTRKLEHFKKSWSEHPTFAPHSDLVVHALERFREKDYVSCCSIIYPRIEGILRTHHANLAVPERPNQKRLSASAVAGKMDNELSLLLPKRFQSYLEEVYFSNFQHTDSNIDISRNSIAHGVAGQSGFGGKAAAIGILIVDQLYYFMDREQTSRAAISQDGNDEHKHSA